MHPNGYFDIDEDVTEHTQSNISEQELSLTYVKIAQLFISACQSGQRELIVSDGGKVLIDIIDSGKLKLRSFTASEIKRRHTVLQFNSGKDADGILNDALEDAVEFGRLRKEDVPTTNKGGKPTVRYYVHSSIKTMGAREDIKELHS